MDLRQPWIVALQRFAKPSARGTKREKQHRGGEWGLMMTTMAGEAKHLYAQEMACLLLCDRAWDPAILAWPDPCVDGEL